MFIARGRLLVYGFAIWLGAAIAWRLGGQYLLHPGRWLGVLVLFAVSFPAMALLARCLCRRFKSPPEDWLSGAVSLSLPTLLLDPFSSAFFPVLFPNMAPQVAGVFGGWMLCCCAGVLAGAMVGHPAKP